MDANCGDYFVALRVNDAEVVRLRIGDINLIPNRIHGQPGWVFADCNRLHVAQCKRINDTHRAAAAVRDVRELVICGVDIGPLTA